MPSKILKNPNRPDPVLVSDLFRSWLHTRVGNIKERGGAHPSWNELDAASFDPRLFEKVPPLPLSLMVGAFLRRPIVSPDSAVRPDDIFAVSGFDLFKLYPDIDWASQELAKRFSKIKIWFGMQPDQENKDQVLMDLDKVLNVLEKYRTVELYEAKLVRTSLLTLEICALKIVEVIKELNWRCIAALADLVLDNISNEKVSRADKDFLDRNTHILGEVKRMKDLETGSPEERELLKLFIVRLHLGLMPQIFDSDSPVVISEENPLVDISLEETLSEPLDEVFDDAAETIPSNIAVLPTTRSKI